MGKHKIKSSTYLLHIHYTYSMQDEACSAGVGPREIDEAKLWLPGVLDFSDISSLALPLEEVDLISVDQWRKRPSILDRACPNPAKPRGSSFISGGDLSI